MADATATVVQQVFALLVRDGTLPRGVFEQVASGFDSLADDTADADRKAAAMQAADVARLILMLAEQPVTRPSLRLVADDPEPDAG